MADVYNEIANTFKKVSELAKTLKGRREIAEDGMTLYDDFVPNI